MSSTERFGALVASLLANGYRPLPIEPGAKRPARELINWPDYQPAPGDEARFRDHSVGIITGGDDGVVPVDCDVRDPELAAVLDALAVRILGDGPVRVGQAPKWLRVYRRAGPALSKRQTRRYRRPDETAADKPHGLELLATGQQFVGFGPHKDTGRPYAWPDGRSPANTPAKSLPLVTDAKLAEFFAEADALLELVAEPVSKQRGERPAHDPYADDPFNEAKRAAALERADDRVIDELRSALERIDPSDRDTWQAQAHRLRPLGERGYRLFDDYSRRCPEKYDADDVHRVFWSADGSHTLYPAVFKEAAANGWRNPRKGENVAYADRVDRTDVGNANKLRGLTAGNLRHVPESDAWMHWDGHCWQRDDYGARAQHEALRIAEHYAIEAKRLREQAADTRLTADEKKKLSKIADGFAAWEQQCRTRARIGAMLELASKMTGVILPAAELDRDPYLLGVANGVVDLRTGALRPTAREDFITKRCTAAYDAEAHAPRWRRFIEEITGEPVSGGAVGAFRRRPQLAEYLQRRTGYMATGVTVEHKLFVDFGAGSNGKDVLAEAVKRALGSYAVTLPADVLMAAKFAGDAERPSPFLAALAGARLAHCPETRDGQKLDTAVVKRHTGGGTLAARRLHENATEFTITHKLLLATNALPSIEHLDDAMRSRLHILPFDRRWNRPGHPEHDPTLPDGDKQLLETLRREDAGILKWIVDGAVAYLRDGLNPPPEVVAVTRTYFRDQDCFARWLEGVERCPIDDGQLASELFAAFRVFCAIEGSPNAHPATQSAFSKELVRKGIKSKRTGAGAKYSARISINLAVPG